VLIVIVYLFTVVYYKILIPHITLPAFENAKLNYSTHIVFHYLLANIIFLEYLSCSVQIYQNRKISSDKFKLTEINTKENKLESISFESNFLKYSFIAQHLAILFSNQL